MDIILTESQYIKVLQESKENAMLDIFTDSKNFTKKIIKDVKKQFGIDFVFLGTWGSVIGGFVGPVSKYMSGRYPNLTETDITLISFGIILTFFSTNKEKLREVLELIKEKKLITFFDRALSKSYDLRDALFGFLESLNLTFSKVSNMIAYTFLVPLVPILKDIADLSVGEKQINLIAMGIGHYLGGIFTSHMVYMLVKKIIERFKS
jgi:hypothetical protein